MISVEAKTFDGQFVREVKLEGCEHCLEDDFEALFETISGNINLIEIFLKSFNKNITLFEESIKNDQNNSCNEGREQDN